jgi:DNA-binding transcriptional MerR regulator
MDKKLGIKVISNTCGVLPHTIRTWERRYGTFRPERSLNGQRLYSEDDLVRAKLIVLLLEHGHQISQISDYSAEELQELVSDTAQALDDDNFYIERSVKSLLGYLERYDIDNVVTEIEHLRLSVGAKDFIFLVVLPVMQEIGLLVAKGKYSVTQEHIISTIVRAQLGQLSLPNIGPKHKRMILATPEGNLHELSILIADILCRANRVPTTYLGAAHPAECLAEATNALDGSTIVMGVVSSDHWDYGQNILKYLEKLDKNLNKEVEVILGGGWEMDFPSYQNIRAIKVMKSFDELDQQLI